MLLNDNNAKFDDSTILFHCKSHSLRKIIFLCHIIGVVGAPHFNLLEKEVYEALMSKSCSRFVLDYLSKFMFLDTPYL